MKKFWRVLLLYSGHISQDRSRSFVFFLITLIQPLLLIAFWKAAFSASNHTGEFTYNAISTYYLLIIMFNTLIPWVEETVSKDDILQGRLSQYILRPYSYYWFKFIEELPYRFLQFIYSIIVISVLSIIFRIHIWESISTRYIGYTRIIFVLSYFLMFNYKMVIGLLAFWMKEATGTLNLSATVMFIFAGFIMPLTLLNPKVFTIANTLPFAYMVYYPVAALQGSLPMDRIIQVIGLQCIWLIFFSLLVRYTWKKGLQTFSSFGQ